MDIPQIIKNYFKSQEFIVKKINSGLVHYVYELKFSDKSLYLKIKGESYSSLPIKTDPKLIKNEYKALKFFSKNFPDIFPHLIKYFVNENAILMSDINSKNKLLIDALNDDKFTSEQAYNLGVEIANIHKKIKDKNIIIRNDNKEFYEKLNGYRFGNRNHNELLKLKNDLSLLPKQLVIGDLSPKNIAIDNNLFKICDLENAHRGDAIVDMAFLATHLIIHSIRDEKKALELTGSYLKGYQKMINEIYGIELLSKIILGLFLYRVDNEVIPYAIKINSNERKKLIKKAISNLKFEKSLNEVIKDITL